MASYTRSKSRIRRYRKTRRRMSGGDILPEDVMFQNRDVCILKPEVKKGILVFSHYTQPKNTPSLCEIGLKSGYQLHLEGVNFGRSIYHPYIFFRAPFYANPIDYSSIDSEIESSFGKYHVGLKNLVWIRVDPDRTFVFSSELRLSETRKRMINASRKTMTEYLRIIKENESLRPGPGQVAKYHLISSKKILFPKGFRNNNGFGFLNSDYNSVINRQEINRNSEVLVTMNHLTPDYFVKCT